MTVYVPKELVHKTVILNFLDNETLARADEEQKTGNKAAPVSSVLALPVASFEVSEPHGTIGHTRLPEVCKCPA